MGVRCLSFSAAYDLNNSVIMSLFEYSDLIRDG